MKLTDFEVINELTDVEHINDMMMYKALYFAPEVVRNQQYTYESDIWSLGVILYEMCTLKFPFLDKSLIGLGMKITKGEYAPISENYSKGIKDLINSILIQDPKARPNIDQILSKYKYNL